MAMQVCISRNSRKFKERIITNIFFIDYVIALFIFVRYGQQKISFSVDHYNHLIKKNSVCTTNAYTSTRAKNLVLNKSEL